MPKADACERRPKAPKELAQPTDDSSCKGLRKFRSVLEEPGLGASLTGYASRARVTVLAYSGSRALAAPRRLKGSVDEIRKGCEYLIASRYDTVVSRARLVTDAIDAATGAEQTLGVLIQALASGDARRAMTKQQRADLVRMALRHYTHLSHHTNAQGSQETFSRQDALFVLAGVAAALWDAIGKRCG